MTSKNLTLYHNHTSGNPPIIVADIDFDNDTSHVYRTGDRVTRARILYRDIKMRCNGFISSLV